jgi:hypothetical protein
MWRKDRLEHLDKLVGRAAAVSDIAMRRVARMAVEEVRIAAAAVVAAALRMVAAFDYTHVGTYTEAAGNSEWMEVAIHDEFQGMEDWKLKMGVLPAEGVVLNFAVDIGRFAQLMLDMKDTVVDSSSQHIRQ